MLIFYICQIPCNILGAWSGDAADDDLVGGDVVAGGEIAVSASCCDGPVVGVGSIEMCDALNLCALGCMIVAKAGRNGAARRGIDVDGVDSIIAHIFGKLARN